MSSPRQSAAADISGALATLRPAALGNTGLVSPRVGLGTHALHRLLARSARRRLLGLAYDLGIRYFDTAPSCGAGLAEKELGWLARRHRAALILATKFGIAPGRLAALLPAGAFLTAASGAALAALRLRPSRSAPVHRDYGVAAMRHSVDSSLRRLRTDFIDILYLHAPTAATLGDPEPLAAALEGLRRAGKVRHFGLSGPLEECLAIAHAAPALAQVLQIELPAGPQGQPCGSPLPPAAAIGCWEFSIARAAATAWPLERVLAGLRQAVPAGIILLSTPREALLRKALGLLAREESGGEPGVAPGFSS